MKTFDVVALGELLVDFTENGISVRGNPVLQANPGGAPCNTKPWEKDCIYWKRRNRYGAEQSSERGCGR